MNNPEPDSPLVFFVKRLEHFPRYLVDYFFGLAAAIISDVIISTIALAAVALGLAIGHWLLVAAFFFTLYSLLRIASIVANAIGSSGQLISNALRTQSPTGQIFTPDVLPSNSVGPHPDAQPRIPVTLPQLNG